MDQAISVMAEENVALHVQFNPLTTTPVVLPKGLLKKILGLCISIVRNPISDSQRSPAYFDDMLYLYDGLTL